MVPVKHLQSQDSSTLLARVSCTVCVLWHCGLILLTQFRVFFLGLLTKLHAVLLLSRSSHLKPIENRPSSNGQVVEVKKCDKKLRNRFEKAGRSVDAGNMQCGIIQTAKGKYFSQLTLNKCNLNDHKRISRPPFISENSALPSTEKNYCQHYLNNKFNQDQFRDEGNCMTDGKCVAVKYPVNQCTITKLPMREWNNIVADQEDCSSIDNEEWGDSDEESDTQCNSYESFSDEEQNEILWKSFFTADPYNPLNFAAQLTSSSTKIVDEDVKEQCLKENVKRRNVAQKPILPQRHFQHFCKLGTRENIKLHVWRKSSKCTKSEEGDKVMSKPASKKLRFSPIVEVHIMLAWSFALREARKGHWIRVAQDRDRFFHRVQNAELAIGYCLHKDHRLKIQEKIHSQARLM